MQKEVDLYAYRVYSIHCQQELTNWYIFRLRYRKAGAVVSNDHMKGNEKR